VSAVTKQYQFVVVELASTVKLRTSIKSTLIPALRCGFAGYPANPRWRADKYCVWKKGRMLRYALKRGKLAIRPTDSMLVMTKAPNVEAAPQSAQETPRRWFSHQYLLILQFLQRYGSRNQAVSSPLS
jgi:hypothetical protein